MLRPWPLVGGEERNTIKEGEKKMAERTGLWVGAGKKPKGGEKRGGCFTYLHSSTCSLRTAFKRTRRVGLEKQNKATFMGGMWSVSRWDSAPCVIFLFFWDTFTEKKKQKQTREVFNSFVNTTPCRIEMLLNALLSSQMNGNAINRKYADYLQAGLLISISVMNAFFRLAAGCPLMPDNEHLPTVFNETDLFSSLN